MGRVQSPRPTESEKVNPSALDLSRWSRILVGSASSLSHIHGENRKIP